jgi:O-antigen ligase
MLPSAQPRAAAARHSPAGGTTAGVLVVFYLFMLYSRIPEFLGYFGLGNLRVFLVVSGICLLIAIASGQLLRAMGTSLGMLVLVLTGWIALAGLFSTWRSGSYRLFTNVWITTLAVQFILLSLLSTFPLVRKGFRAVGFGGLFVAAFGFVLGGTAEGRQVSVGSFSNANALAFHLLLALPACLWIIYQSGLFMRVATAACILPMLYLALRTGSRGGLVILAAYVVLLFLHFSPVSKLLLAWISVGVGFFLVSYLPNSAMDRFRTLFSSQAVDVSTYMSAVESREARVYHLRQSLSLTAQHPIFGVGPGIFQAASAEASRQRGERESWHETHNAYTQVSSECGVPALLLFLSIIGLSWKNLIAVYRRGRARKDKHFVNLSFCMMLSLLAYTLNAFFDSNAYLYYLPLLASLSYSLAATTKEELAPPAPKDDTTIAAFAGPRTGRPNFRPQVNGVRVRT